MADLFNPIAFGAGMIALINPCGFALLPAYLGYFLGMKDDPNQSRIRSLNRSQLVGLSLSLGFMFVFGVLGLVFSGLRQQISEYLPWFSMVVGVLLVILGIAMIRGFQPVVKIPKLDKGTDSDSVFSMFLFGISYAIASLSCTIGVFLAAVGASGPGRGFTEQLGGFLSYGLGMGLLATVLTLAVGFGKRGIITKFRQLLPKINFISGIILIPVGVYVLLYGIWERQTFTRRAVDFTPWLNDFIRASLDIQSSMSNFINNRAGILGWGFVALNAGLIVAGLIERGVIGRQNPGPAARA